MPIPTIPTMRGIPDPPKPPGVTDMDERYRTMMLQQAGLSGGATMQPAIAPPVVKQPLTGAPLTPGMGGTAGGTAGGLTMPWWLQGFQQQPLVGMPVGSFGGSATQRTVRTYLNTLVQSLTGAGALAGQQMYQGEPVNVGSYLGRLYQGTDPAYWINALTDYPPEMQWEIRRRMNEALGRAGPEGAAQGPGQFQVPRNTAGALQAMRDAQPEYVDAPQDIKERGEEQWYQDFQKEHGGQIPEQYYGAQSSGPSQALAMALDDLDWSRTHERATGAPPSDKDWEDHWYSVREMSNWDNRMSKAEWKTKRARQSQKWRKKSRVAAGEQPGKRENARLWEGMGQYEGRGLNVLSDLTWREYDELEYGDKEQVRWLASISKENEPVRWKDWLKLSDESKYLLADGSAGASRKWWGYDTLRIPVSEDVPMGHKRPAKHYPPTTYWNI